MDLPLRDQGPTVAIVGRPNVGKSTLVNRMTGRRDAIVEERPGVTRDWTSHAAEWRGLAFRVLDTGGWTPGESMDPLQAAVSSQAEAAIGAADVVLFVTDATVGVTEEDAAMANWLRRLPTVTVLVANKVDTLGADSSVTAQLAELYALGLGDPAPVSALHGRGSGDLLDLVLEQLRSSGALDRPVPMEADVPGVALIGRPNVGKSSLLNRLAGEERAIVDERPGTTRDAVDTLVTAGGQTYRFVDTAGLRRKARRGDATEYYSTVRTVQALDRAAVALLILDAAETISEQDQKLARRVIDAGRALVLVLNKWDLVDEDRRGQLERERDRLLSFADFAPALNVSAVTGRGIAKILPAVDAVLEQWLRRIPTAVLNEWLADAVDATQPPLQRGRSIRLRYITQVAVGPPTFRVFTTGRLESAYLRYLERRLRERFGFRGTPLTIGVKVRAGWEERDR